MAARISQSSFDLRKVDWQGVERGGKWQRNVWKIVEIPPKWWKMVVWKLLNQALNLQSTYNFLQFQGVLGEVPAGRKVTA